MAVPTVNELLAHWVASSPRDAPRAGDDADGLVQALDAAFATAHARWPSEWVAPEDFVAALADRVDPATDPASSLPALDAAAIYLALACACGKEAAILAFERAHGGEINLALARVDVGTVGLSLEDLRQILRVRLFVGDGTRPPAIASYRGRGPLGRWVFVTALREALQALRRSTSLETELEDSRMQLRQVLGDPELDYLEQGYREAFKACFLAAVDELEIRERNVLRHTLVDGLNVRQIGRMYGVHFTTAARWIGQARERLAQLTKTRLMAQLEVGLHEIEQIIERISSRVELRLSVVFRREPSAPPSP